MAGGGRRRGGGSEEGEDDDDFSDAHALSAQDINVRLSLPSPSTHSRRKHTTSADAPFPPLPSHLLPLPSLCPLLQSLCDKLLKAQEESLHWRGRCMQLEALQIMPLAPLRPPQPPAAAPTPDAPPSLSTGQQEVGPSGVAANARQPPSPTAAAGGAAGNALGRPPRPEALQVGTL